MSRPSCQIDGARGWLVILCGLSLGWLLLLLMGCRAADPTLVAVAPPMSTATMTATTTWTAMPSLTGTATPSWTASPSPTAIPSSTPSPSPTASPSATASPTMTHTPTPLPQVVASYPIAGDRGVDLHGPFTLSLSASVDPERVQAQFWFSPTVQGAVHWPAADRVQFLPQDLVTDTAYALRVSLQAPGLAATEVFSATFETGSGGAPLPILMYHRLRDLADDASQGQRDWSVSPANFRAQMDYLVAQGYHTIDMDALAAYLMRREPLPSRPVVISMDDGWLDVYDVAYPVLSERGLMACLFVLPDYVEYSAYLDWEQMQALREAGFYFGSHSLSHPNLRALEADELERQVVDSKAAIEENVGQPVTAFCYPMGAYNDQVLTALAEAGYQTACTLASGYAQYRDELLKLRRIWVYYDMSLERFASKLPW